MRFLGSLALLPLLILAPIGCGSSDKTESDPSLIKSELPREVSPAASPTDVKELAASNANFAFDFYHASVTKGGKENVFFSPHSLSTALAMTYAGANGTTAQEMAHALRFTASSERLHPAFNALDLALANRGQGQRGADGQPFRLRVVNSLWGHQNTTFLSPFLDTLAVNYGAGMRVVDFVGATEPARVAINRWTERQTEGRIKDLIQPGALPLDTRLVLVNAIYFNAEWRSPFSKQSTASQPFTLGDGTSTNADLMHRTTSFPYAEGDGYQAVELPYAGNETSMVVVLPKEGTWATFESSLNGDLYQKITSGLTVQAVNLALPKFRIEGASVSVKAPLRALGMSAAFTRAADFSGIVSPKEDQLYISDVVHKAFVNVDEKGTEAAAATGVIMESVSAPQNPKVFTANRPFFFFIRDIPTGALLFVGRVTDPKN
ncbi:serpin family protein [Pendulispora albinea]|uniref:Serpin family protein n=1 Tax=Pendulispora albinea TaxID=2741071 RepID=A0ABZ2LKI8_9BACT